MIRGATVILTAAATAVAAAPANLEIPQKYLDQEARARAALSPAEQARVYALVARLSPKTSLQDVKAMAQGGSTDSLFVFMMEYLKYCQKEARDDKNAADLARQHALQSKSAKLQEDAKKLDAQRREADARFESAMAAADVELRIGLASGAAARSLTPTTVRGVPVPTKTPTKTPAPGK